MIRGHCHDAAVTPLHEEHFILSVKAASEVAPISLFHPFLRWQGSILEAVLADSAGRS